MIQLTENQLRDLLKKQRQICAEKAITHDWTKSLDILYNQVKEASEPNWTKYWTDGN